MIEARRKHEYMVAALVEARFAMRRALSLCRSICQVCVTEGKRLLRCAERLRGLVRLTMRHSQDDRRALSEHTRVRMELEAARFRRNNREVISRVRAQHN